MDLSDQVLADIIACALWRRCKPNPKRWSMELCRLHAARVAEHCKMCGVEWTKRQPSETHSSRGYFSVGKG